MSTESDILMLCCMGRPLTSAGFFHLGTRLEGMPIETLKRELDKQEAIDENLSECLLVLPEAFNVVGDYNDADPDPSILKALVRISTGRGVAFVVGLKTRRSPCGGGPFNCAYLIDGGMPRLLACKSSQDYAGGYRERICCLPVSHRGHHIAARICRDALDAESPPDKFKKAILCVPAHFTIENPLNVAEAWNGKTNLLIVANSCSRYPSLMQIHGRSEPELSAHSQPFSTPPHGYSLIKFTSLLQPGIQT
jgi:hypothetical protein